MTVAIVFRPGHSGHFLQSVILDQPADSARFRMADSYKNKKDVVLAHNIDLVLNRPEFSCVYRILPTHNVYNAIYNIFMKKILVEEFPGLDLVACWPDDPMYWYDKCYYHIKDCYFDIMSDIDTNTVANVIDFDRLTDGDYIEQWLLQNFNKKITTNQRQLIKNYASLQLGINLKNDSTTTMEEIIKPISNEMFAQNPWFWAYSVFKFEHNNNLLELDRKWSVNSFTSPQTADDLLSYQYCNYNK